jgi:hypothetical protein
MTDKRKLQLWWTDLGTVGYVSTVFLGRDTGEVPGVPVLFETMARIGPDFSDAVERRYSTWEAAIEGHADLVAEHHRLVALHAANNNADAV